MDEAQTTAPPQAWLDTLQEARDDAAAGRTVSAEQVHAKFRKRLYDTFGERRPVVNGSDG